MTAKSACTAGLGSHTQSQVGAVGAHIAAGREDVDGSLNHAA
jgi:hypothetical protein